jgi:3-dehydroquinate synthase
MTHTQLTVALGERSYDIVIGAGLLQSSASLLQRILPASRVFVVTDQTVADLYLGMLTDMLDQVEVTADVTVLPPGEQNKSLANLETLSRA